MKPKVEIKYILSQNNQVWFSQEKQSNKYCHYRNVCIWGQGVSFWGMSVGVAGTASQEYLYAGIDISFRSCFSRVIHIGFKITSLTGTWKLLFS